MKRNIILKYPNERSVNIAVVSLTLVYQYFHVSHVGYIIDRIFCIKVCNLVAQTFSLNKLFTYILKTKS